MTRYSYLFLVFVLMCAYSTTLQAQTSDTQWYEIKTKSGHKVGYSSQLTLITPTHTKIIDRQSTFGPRDQTTQKLFAREASRVFSAGGQPLKLTIKYNSRTANVATTVTFDKGAATLNRKTHRNLQERILQIPDGTQFDYGLALLKTWNFKHHGKLEFLSFNISAGHVQRVVITPLSKNYHAERRLVRKTYDGNNLRAIAILTVDKNGEILKLEQPILSTAIIKTKVDALTAKKRGPRIHVSETVGIKSPYRMSRKALKGHIRYSFDFKYGVPIHIPETHNQSVKQQGDTVTLDICKSCGIKTSLSETQRLKHLEATPWMQINHTRIQTIAKSVSKKNLSDHDIMTALGLRTRRIIKDINFSGHFSAVEALSRRSGDCTEDAVTLAALGRAAGIPTRVVSGLVYSREAYHGVTNRFVSHSWVQAWVGETWVNYDISMGEFNSGHIVLAIGDGDPALVAAGNSLSGFLQIKSMAQIETINTQAK